MGKALISVSALVGYSRRFELFSWVRVDVAKKFDSRRAVLEEDISFISF